MTGIRILLDEHVGRVFERVLREWGYGVEQAKDRFGERTTDAELVAWCSEGDVVLLTNNAKDFESLHAEYDHAGILFITTRTSRIPIPKDSLERWAKCSSNTVQTVSRTDSSTSGSGTTGFRSRGYPGRQSGSVPSSIASTAPV